MMKQPNYAPNTAQKRLAEEVTKIIHGEEGVKTALRVTEAASPGARGALDSTVLENIASDMPSHTCSKEDVLDAKLIDLLVKYGLQSSKGDARKLIRNGGVYINNEQIQDENFVLTPGHLIDGKMLLIAVGKKNKILLRIS